MKKNHLQGFTLIEIAIVLLIVTILLGYSLALFPIQQELKQYRQADKEMDKIIDSIYSFAQINGYIPCPSNAISSGFECRDNNATAGDCDGTLPTQDCDLWYGNVPAKTLGLNGKYNAAGLLLDPWGTPYVYQVTNSDNEDNNDNGVSIDVGDGDGVGDFIAQGGIRVTADSNSSTTSLDLFLLNPDLSVCNIDPSAGAAGAADVNCSNAGSTIIGGIAGNLCTNPNKQCAAAVVMSRGKNAEGNVAATSWVQRENLDNSTTDRVFVSAARSEVTNAEFDDLVKWITPNILYGKMIESGQLP